jgi:hypothetical protein
MKESYVEGLATHSGPESCVAVREGSGEALTGVRAGRVPHPGRRYRETLRDPARSETPCTYGNTSRENREIPCPPAADGAAGRVGKFKDARR